MRYIQPNDFKQRPISKALQAILGGAAAVLVAASSTASANNVVTISTGVYSSGGGGEFTMKPGTGDDGTIAAITGLYNSLAIVGGGFETFCLEKNQFFTSGTTYGYTITNGAIPGGVSGGNPDNISAGTAWLYSQFAAGTLVDYYYDSTHQGKVGSFGVNLAYSNRVSAAGALQEAFWYLEDEQTLTSTQISNNKFLQLLTTSSALGGAGFSALTGTNSAHSDASAGQYGVGVLDLTVLPPGSGYAQDQLTLLPPGGGKGGSSVPDGGPTVCLLGVSLVGLALVKRRLATA